jgi:predicted membrane channel-forming protein YqfA (hemolysin III family)
VLDQLTLGSARQSLATWHAAARASPYKQHKALELIDYCTCRAAAASSTTAIDVAAIGVAAIGVAAIGVAAIAVAAIAVAAIDVAGIVVAVIGFAATGSYCLLFLLLVLLLLPLLLPVLLSRLPCYLLLQPLWSAARETKLVGGKDQSQ